MRLDSQSLLALVGITTTFVGITTGSVVVADAAQIEAAKVECGSAQNVMRVPEGADAAQYRTCIEHPLGAAAGPRAGESLVKRDCWYGANTGCTNGYCWKRCGDDSSLGNWCWTASNGGQGDWYQCSLDSQCYDYMDCGGGCSC